jgi:hypothetical protein
MSKMVYVTSWKKDLIFTFILRAKHEFRPILSATGGRVAPFLQVAVPEIKFDDVTRKT